MDPGFWEAWSLYNLGEAIQDKECQIIKTNLGSWPWTEAPAKEEH